MREVVRADLLDVFKFFGDVGLLNFYAVVLVANRIETTWLVLHAPYTYTYKFNKLCRTFPFQIKAGSDQETF